MTDRTAGGLFLPNDEVLAMVDAAAPRPSEEPTAASPAELVVAAGHASHYFVTDPGAWTTELYDPRVLVTSAPIERAADLVPLLEAAARDAQPIVIAAPSVAKEALALLIVNKLRGTLQASALVTSELDAIAACLGTTVRPTLDASDLPRAKRVVSGARTTLFVP